MYEVTESIRLPSKPEANLSLSIKNASNDELEAIIARLRKEREAQQIISELKNLGKRTMYVNSFGEIETDYRVSTEEPISSMYHEDQTSEGGTLEHHGVLGMKWGVRKKRRKSTSTSNKTTSSETTKKSEELNEDYLEKLRLKNKALSQLSNKELQAFNTRMQLEKTYKDLTKKQDSPFVKAAKNIVVKSAEEAAKEVVKSFMKKGISSLTGVEDKKPEEKKKKKS